MRLIEGIEAMERCAVAMEVLTGTDLARDDVRVIYEVAAMREIAERRCAAQGFQIDPRIPVPDWLMEYGGPPRDSGVGGGRDA